jgi:hypothetical protein
MHHPRRSSNDPAGKIPALTAARRGFLSSGEMIRAAKLFKKFLGYYLPKNVGGRPNA